MERVRQACSLSVDISDEGETSRAMDLRYRLLVNVKGQVPSRILDGPLNQLLSSRHAVSTANVHVFPPSMFCSSVRSGHLSHTARNLRPVRYADITKEPAPYYSRHTSNNSSLLRGRPEQQVPAQYLGRRVQPRLFSSLSFAEYFENHEVSSFPEFAAGLRAFRKSQFLNSAQEFNRLCDIVQQITKRQTLKENIHLLPWGCLAAALFRGGAYKRAEQVSREIMKEIIPKNEIVVGQSACFSSFRAFAAIVASSAAFECSAQKQEYLIKETRDAAADCKGTGNKATRTEKKGTFFPLQELNLCLSSAVGTWKADLPSHERGGYVCLWELQILKGSLAGAATPSEDVKTKHNCMTLKEQGFLFDFLNLVQSYNHFVLKVYRFLSASLPARHAMGKPEEELIRCYLLTAEKLLNHTSAVLERFESQKRKSHLFSSETTSFRESPARSRHESGSHGEKNEGKESTDDIKWKSSGKGAFCEAILEDEYAEQAVIGAIQVCKGVGSSLIRLCAQDNANTPLVDLGASSVTRDGFAMGQAALKKGLILCKQYAEMPCRLVKGGLLASLAASFHRIGEAVVSEGLFRSALVEFAGSTCLQVESLMEAPAEKLSQPRLQAVSGATRQVGVIEGIQKPQLDDEKLETATPLGSHLTFADRFEYASALLQYSFLLTRWEGREFEAKKLRKAAAELSPVLVHTTSDAEGNSRLECWLFSLLWKPPITVATCMDAAATNL